MYERIHAIVEIPLNCYIDELEDKTTTEYNDLYDKLSTSINGVVESILEGAPDGITFQISDITFDDIPTATIEIDFTNSKGIEELRDEGLEDVVKTFENMFDIDIATGNWEPCVWRDGTASVELTMEDLIEEGTVLK